MDLPLSYCGENAENATRLMDDLRGIAWIRRGIEISYLEQHGSPGRETTRYRYLLPF
jgi:hypothetical protein